MRMPRFTIRRMMVLVAAIAVCVVGLMEAVRLYRLSTRYRATLSLARMRLQAVDADTKALRIRSAGNLTPGMRRALENSERRQSFYRFLIWKYERAARFPWLPVEPDQPIPR